MRDCWAIIPAHNRREITIGCLRHLEETGVLHWLNVIVIDDGSSDGTSATIRAKFPLAQILSGDGNLWWGGAINLGMKFAVNQGAQNIIWLNDDCHPHKGVLEMMVNYSLSNRCVAVGHGVNAGLSHYGGKIKGVNDVFPSEVSEAVAIRCEAFSGNCVCFPADIVRRVGLIDVKHLPHNYGDLDYGLRISAADIPIMQLNQATFINLCENPPPVRWFKDDVSLWNEFKKMRSLKSHLHPKSMWFFYVRHWKFRGFWKLLRIYSNFLGACIWSAGRLKF